MKSQQKTQRKKAKQEYVEEPGWMSAFLREDATGKQPKYTGVGKDIDGDDIQVSVWPTTAKSGVKYLRIRIEPPYEAEDVEDDDEPDDDDIPF